MSSQLDVVSASCCGNALGFKVHILAGPRAFQRASFRYPVRPTVANSVMHLTALRAEEKVPGTNGTALSVSLPST